MCINDLQSNNKSPLKVSVFGASDDTVCVAVNNRVLDEQNISYNHGNLFLRFANGLVLAVGYDKQAETPAIDPKQGAWGFKILENPKGVKPVIFPAYEAREGEYFETDEGRLTAMAHNQCSASEYSDLFEFFVDRADLGELCVDGHVTLERRDLYTFSTVGSDLDLLPVPDPRMSLFIKRLRKVGVFENAGDDDESIWGEVWNIARETFEYQKKGSEGSE